jgi:hypothetical protein
VHNTSTAPRWRSKGQFGGNLATASEDFFNICRSPGAADKKPRNDRSDDRIDQRFRGKACSEAPARRDTLFFNSNAIATNDFARFA